MKPIINPARDFIAIDVEYANNDQDICQIGLAIVKDLQVVNTLSYLIQPPGNAYDDNQTRTHHLTSDDTLHAPFLDVAWQEIQPILFGQQLWAHNAASVEQPVLVKNIDRCGYDSSWIEVFDSRDLYQRPDCPANSGNGLEQCCQALGIEFDGKQHHNAEYDALKCAEIVIAYAQGRQPEWNGVAKNSEELRKQQQGKRILRLGEFQEYYANHESGTEDVFAELTSTRPDAQPQVVDVFDKGDKMPSKDGAIIEFSRLNLGDRSAIRDKTVVVTGLFSIKQDEIKRAVKDMGGKVVQNVTGNTDVVIFGPRNVGFKKLIPLEQQEQRGHHIARIVGDADLKALLYGDGHRFFEG